MPDGRGIAYHKDSNVWIQPLDGGPARQLTHFTDGRTIPDFAWSRDGKRLAIARMSVTNDIVLFKGLRKVAPMATCVGTPRCGASGRHEW